MISFKTFLPRSLLGRSLLILVIPVLLIQIIMTYVFFERHWNRMSSRLAFAVAGEIAVIANYIEQEEFARDDHNSIVIADYFTRSLDLSVRFEPGAVLSQEKERVAGASGFHPAVQAKETIVYGFLSRALEKQAQWPYQIHIDIEEKWLSVSVQLSKGVVYISLPPRRLFSSSGYVFLLWMMGASFVLLMIAVLFMRNQVRPIRRLAIAAERFGKGRDIPESFKIEGAREVRQAGRAFLDMQERIKRQIDQRTAMLSGVSHDLRTPLTRMKLQVEMLKDCPDIDALKNDIADMERMIEAYLEFARGEGDEQTVRTDIGVLLERLVKKGQPQKGALELELTGDLFVLVKPVAFERCLENILGNARKYASHIHVKVQRLDEGIEITVDDDGPGIPVEEREAVFRPFYRVDESRNFAIAGVGLGLPIAQGIVHAHGGEISLQDSPQGGLRVFLCIPV